MNLQDQLNQKLNRKFGEDRLKIKIDFSPEQNAIDYYKNEENYITFESKYEVGIAIGQGAHAIVKLAWKKNSRQKKPYAVKIVRSGDSEIQDSVQRTYDTISKLNHPGIIKVKELFIDEKLETSYLVMEYCRFKSLDQILKTSNKLSEEKVRLFMIKLLEAVQFLHENYVCHRDLKPDNILVDFKSGAIKIVDFGVSSYCNQAMWTKTGNVFYGAPEIHTKCGYSEKIDIWSIGVVMYQSLTNCLPFQEQSVISTIHKITNFNENSHFENKNFLKLSLNCQDVLKKMLDRISESRFTAKQCLEHPFFKEKEEIFGDLFYLPEKFNFDNFILKDILSKEQIEKQLNDSNEEITYENSLTSSIDIKPQIHRVKGIQNGRIDLVSSFHMSCGSQSIIKLNINNSLDEFQLHPVAKSNSQENLSNEFSLDNFNDTSFDQLMQKHQIQESIVHIVEEEDESIEQV